MIQIGAINLIPSSVRDFISPQKPTNTYVETWNISVIILYQNKPEWTFGVIPGFRRRCPDFEILVFRLRKWKLLDSGFKNI